MKSNLFVNNFNTRIKENINRIKKLPRLKGVKKIIYPGQNKYYRFKKNINSKIKINKNIIKDLESLISKI